MSITQVNSRLQRGSKVDKKPNPYVPKELVARLLEDIPEQVVVPGDQRDQIMYYAGMRKVVDTLRRWANE